MINGWKCLVLTALTFAPCISYGANEATITEAKIVITKFHINGAKALQPNGKLRIKEGEIIGVDFGDITERLKLSMQEGFLNKGMGRLGLAIQDGEDAEYVLSQDNASNCWARVKVRRVDVDPEAYRRAYIDIRWRTSWIYECSVTVTISKKLSSGEIIPISTAESISADDNDPYFSASYSAIHEALAKL